MTRTESMPEGPLTLSEPPPPGAKWHVQSRCRRDQNSNTLLGQISIHLTSSTKITYGQRVFPSPRPTAPKVAAGKKAVQMQIQFRTRHMTASPY